MAEKQGGFWNSAPGILTGVAAVLTALTGLYVATKGTGGRSDAPTSMPSASAVSPGASPATARAEIRPSGLGGRSDELFVLVATIDDPDGYTYVRSMRSRDGQVVARVERGERFHTYRQSGAWWQVRTGDGKTGYMHVSRIKLLSNR